jgi:hypothetical protein
MKVLAKSVDVGEVEKVLKVRYLPERFKGFAHLYPRMTRGISCSTMFPTKGNGG